MSDINDRYNRFGKGVVDQVQLELNRHGDLKTLLTRIHENAPDDLEAQHNELTRVITRYGPLFFLTVSKSDWTREQIERIKGNLKAGVDTPLPGTLRRLTPSSSAPSPGKPLATPSQKKSLTPIPGVEPRKIYPSERKPIVQPRSPYSAPSKEQLHPHRRQSDVQDRRQPPPERAIIESETYKGPDRRVLRDRRQGPRDRRAKLDMVYKNQRFGGRDRRKTVRRASDRDS
jgi:hypothetical protein